jgi:hypothetical protein
LTVSNAAQSEGQVAPRRGSSIGIAAALILALPFIVSLLQLWPSQRAAAMMPLAFGAGIVICGIMALVQERGAVMTAGGRQLVLLAAVALCGASIWMRVPYGITIAFLIGCCFLVIGKRSWPMMIGVVAVSELLAYGVFKWLLGIPIH